MGFEFYILGVRLGPFAKKITKSNYQLRHVILPVRASLWDSEKSHKTNFREISFYIIHIYIYIYLI